MKISIVPMLAASLLLAACAPGDTAPPDTSGTSADSTQVGLLADSTRTPEEVPGAVPDMLPRYPGAEPPPPDVPAGFATSPLVSACHREQCPQVHTASEHLSIEATEGEIEAWYWNQLVSQGYHDAERGY